MTNTNEWKQIGAQNGDAWDFETNPEMIGIYIGKEEGIGTNNSTLYNFEKPEGVVSVWSTALLDSRFKNLKEGEEVKVIYLGKEKSPKTGRTYKNFEVYHRQPAQDVDEIPFP